jgi:hypothetical protein
VAKLFCNLELRVKNYEDPSTFPTFYQLVKKEMKEESKKQRLNHGDMEESLLDPHKLMLNHGDMEERRLDPLN